MNYYPTPTYKQNRKCLHCGRPIADQEHASRKFCPRSVLQSGNIQSCKDDYHSQKNRPLLAPFREMARWQRFYHSRIWHLFEKEGDRVTLELINRYGINLSRPFQFEVTKEGKLRLFYHEFVIEQLTETKFKISRHELF